MQKHAILQFISDIGKRIKLNWWETGLVLDAVQKEKYWQMSSTSFSSWVRDNEYRFNSKVNTLWRILSAVRFTQYLQQEYADEVSIPEIHILVETISPESIEILTKLKRVIENDKFIKLANDTYMNKIGRNELRKLWLAYRPVTQGKTARGKQRDIQDNTKDANQLLIYEDSKYTDKLIETKLEIFKNDNASCVKFYVDISFTDIEKYSDIFKGLKYDEDKSFINSMATYINNEGILVSHGFIGSSNGFQNDQGVLMQKGFFDYLWRFMTIDSSKLYDAIEKRWPYVGILSIKNGRLLVEKRPEKLDTDMKKIILLNTITFDKYCVQFHK